jgi:ERCC4-type nuclease
MKAEYHIFNAEDKNQLSIIIKMRKKRINRKEKRKQQEQIKKRKKTTNNVYIYLRRLQP